MDLTITVNPVELFMTPEHAIQKFSLLVLQEQQRLVDKMIGLEWNNSQATGKVVDCTCNVIVVKTAENKRHELPVTGPRLRQLLAATTTRK